MTRSEARKHILALTFEKSFHDTSVPEIIELATEAREFEADEFIHSSVVGIFENIERIDYFLSEKCIGWKLNRVSRVSLSIMRLAVYEMLFCEDIPVSVSINEAVELAKTYAGEEDPAYINGVLGSISKELGKN